MSKRRKTKSKKTNSRKKKAEHNSWLYALWSLVVDTFVSLPKNSAEDEAVLNLSDKLGKEGKRKQNTLLFGGWIIFCIAMVILCISLTIEEYNRDACIWMGIFAALAVCSVLLKIFYFDRPKKK